MTLETREQLVDAVGEAVAPLYPYQVRWLLDPAHLKAGRWCRSAGKTHGVMLEPVFDCHLAEVDRRRANWFVFAGAEGQTKEMIRYASLHCQALELGAQMGDDELKVDGEKFTIHVVEFPEGSRIVGLPTNPLTIRGRHGNLIWDEAGKTPDDEAVWAAAAPIAGRKGFKLRLVGTPGAKRGPFYRVCSGEMKGWSLHTVDVYKAIAEGAPLDLEKIKALTTGRAFVTEYLVEFEDEDTRLISVDAIIACESDDALLVPYLVIDADRNDWQRHLDRAGEAPPSAGYDSPAAWRRLFAPLAGRELYLGYDVGRSKDLSVLWIEEELGGLRWTRAVVALRGRRYAEQKACLWAAFEHCRRGCIDQGVIGNQLAEETVERFGAKAEGVQFSTTVKEDLAVRVLRSFEDRTNRLPRAEAIRMSLNSVYKTTTAAGHTRFDSASTDAGGHADYFWSMALAKMAAGDSQLGDLGVLSSFGRRTWSRSSGVL